MGTARAGQPMRGIPHRTAMADPVRIVQGYKPLVRGKKSPHVPMLLLFSHKRRIFIVLPSL
jgi:hypothetical protein